MHQAEGIEEIGWQAFLGCTHVKRYHLPSTLKKIGNAAFYCYNDKPSQLREVQCDAAVPPACGEMVWGSRFNAHEGNDRDSIVLYVPVGSVQAYRAEKQWDYFNYIVDVEGQESSTVDEQHYNPNPDDDPDNQAIEDVMDQTKAKSRKVIMNGQLYIIRGNKMFDITGTLIED